jgi:hypothetical protein
MHVMPPPSPIWRAVRAFVGTALMTLLVSACQLLGSLESPPGASSAASGALSSAPPTPTPRRTVSLPELTPAPSFTVYAVRSGDTLLAIARRFRTTPLSLSYWNRDRYPSLDPDAATYRPNRIEVGWRLRVIPGIEADPEDFLPAPPSESPIASSNPSTS